MRHREFEPTAEPELDLDAAMPDDEEAPSRRGWLGAVIVGVGLVAFAGVIWFAYDRGSRAGTDSVAPIVRADPAPTKVRPANPGGMDIPNQDKLIYDRLKPGAEGEKVEHLLPPPEAPLPVAKGQKAAPAAPAKEPQKNNPTTEAATAPAVAPTPTPSPAPAPASSASTNAAAPLPSTNAAEMNRLVASVANDKPAVSAAPAATGGIRIQIASVPSAEVATNEWRRLSRRYPDLLGGLEMRVIQADLGAKGIYHRVQAGPVDEAKAKAICEAMKAKGDGCIPVRN